ncbi:M48 family metallopeptidase [Geoalkalibacter subterraneus]|uniref:M48 family metallopeptidase n=1 Tax=Geoalkalibacter subterraneus TaxID=483547 RepID=UPI00130E4E44|nr:M48 family metalloprotease [Geoalkalibacter subterraneus]
MSFFDIHASLNAPPQLNEMLLAGGAAAILLVFLQYFIFSISPLKYRLKKIFPGTNLKKVDKESVLAKHWQNICTMLNIEPPPLFIAETHTLNAFAYEAGWKKAVIVSAGLINHFHIAEILWVLSHEAAHIKYKDAKALTLMTSGSRSIIFGCRIRNFILSLIARSLSFLRFVPGSKLIILILIFPLNLISILSSFTLKTSLFIFNVLDSMISRRMELRCDKVAAETVGYEPAISALHKLNQKKPPLLGLNTHPCTKRRIRLLEKHKKSPAI